jgi:hypothetical protein
MLQPNNYHSGVCRAFLCFVMLLCFGLRMSSPPAVAMKYPAAKFALFASGRAPSAVAQQAPEFTSKETLKFKLIKISDGPMDKNRLLKAPWFKIFSLVASNGNELYVLSIPFRTTGAARKEYQASIKSAKIVRRNPELNKHGENIGERALVLSPGDDGLAAPDNAPHYSVIWTSDRGYWKFTGKHLEDVSALEASLKEEGTSALWKW